MAANPPDSNHGSLDLLIAEGRILDAITDGTILLGTEDELAHRLGVGLARLAIVVEKMEEEAGT